MMIEQIVGFIDELTNLTKEGFEGWKSLQVYHEKDRRFSDLNELILIHQANEYIDFYLNESYYYLSENGLVAVIHEKVSSAKDGSMDDNYSLYIKINETAPLWNISEGWNLSDRVKKLHHQIQSSIAESFEMPADLYKFMSGTLSSMRGQIGSQGSV